MGITYIKEEITLKTKKKPEATPWHTHTHTKLDSVLEQTDKMTEVPQ